MKTWCMVIAALALMAPAEAEPTWFAPDAATKQSLDVALATALKSNHRLIVIYDGSWCTLCAEMHKAAMADPDIPKLIHSGYEIAHVTADDPKGLAQFASQALHVSLEKAGGLLITLLENDGSVLATWTAEWVKDHDQFSTAKLKSQLSSYLLGPPAEEVYRAALSSLPKGLVAWVEFRADWCGWCRKMERFFADSDAAPILAKYYKVITIDTMRNPGADGLAKSLGAPHGTNGGIPWFAVVDAEGKTLATSEGPKGNIGYPDTEVEVAHFMSVLKTTAHGITANELDTIANTIQALRPKATTTGSAKTDSTRTSSSSL